MIYLLKLVNYIGEDYYNEYIIVGDDMLMNIVTYQFANNFSNIQLPGYLYNQRKVSMSRGGNDELKQIRAKNFICYYQKFFKYKKDYKKDINMTECKSILLDLFIHILQGKGVSIQFQIYLQRLSLYYQN